MFVKLKDEGGIFHDASQDATVTGSAVVEVKKTEKVTASIKGGLLVEVSQEDAEKLIAKQEGKKVAVKNDAKSTDFKALEKDLETTTTAKEEVEAKLDEALTEQSNLATAKEEVEAKLTTVTTELETLKAEYDAYKIKFPETPVAKK